MKRKYVLRGRDEGYEIYAKKGTLRGCDSDRHTRNTQIRLVPSDPYYRSSIEGETLARLEEDGNGVDLWLGELCFRLDYCQYDYLAYLMEARRRIDPPWWEEPTWSEEKLNKKGDQ